MFTIAIFTVTFVAVSLTRLPRIKVDRPAAAFAGAIAMVLTGALTFSGAISAVDWNTIALLLGMMVLIAALQLDGYTEAIARVLFGHVRTGHQLLWAIVIFTGLASAFLVNDAVVLVLTPIVVTFCLARHINPIPFLIAEAMASNIGSVAAITGNPQNMLIGLQSGIAFGRFMLLLLPVAVLSSILLVVVINRVHHNALVQPFAVTPPSEPTNGRLRVRPSIIILLFVLLGFIISPWLGATLPMIALCGAGLVLIFSRHSPKDIFHHVDWVLLLFFAGLFIVIRAVVAEGVFDSVINSLHLNADLPGIAALHGISLALSQLISNVPYTVLMLPILQANPSDLIWLALASAATLAGNLTLIGAVANLIVAESASDHGVEVSFWDFFKVGIPVTLITMVISVVVLWLESMLGIAWH